jgi:hypothetical protein
MKMLIYVSKINIINRIYYSLNLENNLRKIIYIYFSFLIAILISFQPMSKGAIRNIKLTVYSKWRFIK